MKVARESLPFGIGLLAWGLLTGAFFAAASHALDPAKSLGQYTHRVWDMDDGLPHDSVRAIVQDADGYLWLGTQAGLARFDGKRFRVWDGRQHPALGDGHIEALAIDADGRLYIGTYGGLVRYAHGAMRRFGVADGLPGSRILSLHASGDTLWIGTYEGGVARLRQGRIEPFSEAGGTRHPIIPDIAVDTHDATLWVSSFGGLHRFRQGRLTLFGRADGLANDRIWETSLRADGSLWVATDRGLHLFGDEGILASHSVETGLSHPRILSVLEDRHGQVWAGTFGGGLNRLGAAGEWSHLESPQAGHDAIFWTLVEDRDGNIWGGTLLDGLHRFGDGAFTLFGDAQGLPRGQINAIAQAPGGHLYFAVRDRGLAELRPDGTFLRRTPDQGLPSDRIDAIWIEANGVLWVASSDGIYVRDPQRDRERAWSRITGQPEMPIGPVFDLRGTRDGAIWIAGTRGVWRYFEQRFEAFDRRHGLPSERVGVLYEDPLGRLWLGTDRGLALYLPSAASASFESRSERALPFRSYGEQQGLPDSPITTLYGELDGDLWIGTGGSGLYRSSGDPRSAEDHRIEGLSSARGLYDDDVRLLLGDDLGRLWMACSRGVVHMAIDALEAKIANPELPLFQAPYHRADGLGGPARASAGFRDRHGRLWFGTGEGAAMVAPANLLPTHPPTPRIEAMEVDGLVLPTDPPPKLDPDHTDVLFRFSAPSLSSPDKIRLHYRLLGLDTEWREAPDNLIAEFTHLPPGPYVFEVTSSDALGHRSEVPTRLAFRVERSFLTSGPFFIAAALGILLLVYSGHRWRVSGLEARRRRLESEVEAALGEVKILRGMLPICARCKRIRDDEGFWQGLEDYVTEHTEAELETALCSECESRRSGQLPRISIAPSGSSSGSESRETPP